MFLNKKIISKIAFLSAIAFQCTHATIELPTNVDASRISINYDFHDVLFKSNYEVPAACLATTLVGSSVLGGYLFGWKGAVGFPATILASIAIIATRVISNIKKQLYRLEEKAFESDPWLKPLLPLYIQLESFFKPNEKMFELVKNVSELGINQKIASNINEGSLTLLQERHKQSKIFDYFSDILSPTKDYDFVNKRKNGGQDFFEKLATMNQQYDLVLYVDDKESNCDLAKKHIGEKCKTFFFKKNSKEKGIEALKEFIQKELDKYSQTLNKN